MRDDATTNSKCDPAGIGMPACEDETDLTEITIQPDGRIYVFGASRQVVQMLWKLSPADQRLPRLLSRGQWTGHKPESAKPSVKINPTR